MSGNDLIERAERETGRRIDSNGFDNDAMSVVMGALARALGKSSHDERDDFVAGTLIKHQMSPEGKAQQKNDEMLRQLLLSGLSPDDIEGMF